MFTDGHVPPSTMHPEPELRVPADVHLEHIGATLGELGNRMFVVGWRRLDGVFVDHPESTTWKRQRKHGYHRCAGSQRQRGERGCRGRRPIEERDIDRVGGLHMLIDQE